MDPISMGTLATVSMVTSGLGGGVSALGSLTQGQASSDMYRYQSGVATINQQIAKQNASYERSIGEVQAQKEGMKGRFEAGQIRAQQAGSGLDITRGTTARVSEGQEAITRYDESLIRSNAARKAYGYDVESEKQLAQARMYQQAAKGAKTEGYLGALGSVLGATSSVSSKWLQGKKAGFWENTS